MSAAPEPLTAEEIAYARCCANVLQGSRCVIGIDLLRRLCDAAESAAAQAAEIAELRQRAERAEADAARYRWARPVLSGDDDETGDKRAVVIGLALAQGRDIDSAIDDAIAASQPKAEVGK